MTFTSEEKNKMRAVRAALHRRPEPGNSEKYATELILGALSGLGLETLRPLLTGAVGVLRTGRPGPTVLLRADIDALPVTEETGAPFASETPGLMHACGHDVHTAALLGAALLLTREKDRLCGTVLFVFQPDEEGDGGALRLLESGALDGADYCFGCHVDPALPEGTVGVRYGVFYASAATFDLTFRGASCHGATPEKGTDALACAAAAVEALRALPEEVAPERSVVNVGTFRAGTARNIVADTAVLQGIIRAAGEETRERLIRLVYGAAEETAARFGAKAEAEIRVGYPGVTNAAFATAAAEKAAIAAFGKDRVVRINTPTMTTEDFGFYQRRIPGSFYHIGAGCSYPLHSPRFLPTDTALFTAAETHAAVVMELLKETRAMGLTLENLQ